MSKISYSFIVYIILISLNLTINGFNLSPKPNIVIHDPNLKTFRPKLQSTYFGYTINLRKTSIIIGAPRAQSSLESQRDVNETGAIYKCSLKPGGICQPFIFDSVGNTKIEDSQFSYDSELKHYQWLGASMDGGPKDTDKLVVCAPRLIAELPNDYLMHGICYWTPDTLGDKPSKIRKISPLRLKHNQLEGTTYPLYFYHMFGEQGISVHITDNEKILIGAPGVHTWKGSIILYYGKRQEDINSLSRRDNHALSVPNNNNIVQYDSVIPNPKLWQQPNDSYFGYAVSSGYFDSTQPSKLMYMATAPQANEQAGEAYIFNVVQISNNENSITKHHTFRGTQFGEYFGYSVLTEDLNGDMLPDIIISAPQYSEEMNFDKGAIYVFINKGRLTFELQKKIVCPSNAPGRFGTTLSKLGDINHDGYFDIAVGAPFQGNGVVYVYLGGPKGLRETPSQIIKSPTSKTLISVPTQAMFGHGISRGSDIDSNGFNDLAIGAPNSEAVYIYRAYPVVKIVASINSLTRELQPNDSKFDIRVCYQISTTSSKSKQQDLAMKVKVDPHVQRVKFSENGNNEIDFNVTANDQSQCRILKANVKYSIPDIFKPIELEMHYNIINGIPNSEEFCETCAAIDPNDPVFTSEKITFSTGCKSAICVADLKVESSGLSPTFILGSNRILTVKYDIQNLGETAYLPQINITSSNHLPFAKLPPSCNQIGFILLCNLFRGRPMSNNDRDSISISYDVNNLDGTSLTLSAKVFSTGEEKNHADNTVINTIVLKESSAVEIIGQPITQAINLEKVFNKTEIINSFEIKNNGPSKVKEVEVAFYIPVAYKIDGITIPIIDSTNITIQGVYNGQIIPVEFFQNEKIIIQNPIEYTTQTISAPSNIKTVDFDMAKMGYSLEQEQQTEQMNNFGMNRRRRRSVKNAATKVHYSQISTMQSKSVNDVSEELMGKLPINRTILFNCQNPAMTTCIRAVMRIYNFNSGSDNPLTVMAKFNVDLNEVNEILIEPWEFFVIVTGIDFTKIGDRNGETISVLKKMSYNIISKHQLYSTPIWIYIVSILGGLLLLAAIIYALRRFGFFQRKNKDKLEQLKRQSQALNQTETDCDDD